MISEGSYTAFFYLNTYNHNCKNSYNSLTAVVISGDLQIETCRQI